MPIKEASVLFGRLSGLAELIANETQRESSELLDKFFEQTESAIRMFNGGILEFSGESFSAFFEDDQAQTNAVEAARKCQERIRILLKEKHVNARITFKAGIAHATVVRYTSPAREKQSIREKPAKIMGEAVDLAERLFAFAENGQILVDRPIYDQTSDSWRYNKLEPLHIAGSKELLEVFELKEKRRKRTEKISSSTRQIFSVMVGRGDELKLVEQKIEDLIAGKGSILSIVGKAGIGKSRLMAEIKVQPCMSKVMLLEGRAVSTGQNLSFHPIASLIKSWAGILEDDIPSVSSKKLFQGLKTIAPQQSDEIYAFLATMMGLPLQGKHKERVKDIEGEALEKLILKNIRDLIIAASQDRPRIYMIEDLHWADSSSITMFESLYKLSQNYPVMFINVMRPGYEGTSDYIIKYLSENFTDEHTAIHVNPLQEKESSSLIINLLRKTQLPEEIRSMIIRKTEGNPFFIEEIIRNFIDEGIIDIKDDHFVITDKIKDVNIPETINDVVLSRVDKLDEKTRELLNTASVMGRNFYYKVLEEATDTIEELDDRLSYLTEVQLISESKKKQEIEYLFKHALSQQLTYDAIMQQSRIELHNKIARSIEKVFANNINEFYGTLAYHYTNAENKEKTIQYLVLAGDESSKSGASAEALQFYLSARDLMLENRKSDYNDSEIRDLDTKIALGYHSIGDNGKAIESFEALMQNYFQIKIPKTERAIKIKGTLSILGLMFIINNQRLFFRKDPIKDFDLLSKIANNWGYALLHFNSRHWAFKVAYLEVILSRYYIHDSSWAMSLFTDSSSLFSLGGVSLKTAQKFIDFAHQAGAEKKQLPSISLFMMRKIQAYYKGKWEEEENFDDAISTGVKIGKSWISSSHVYYNGMCSIESGNYASFLRMAEILKELTDSLDNPFTRTLWLRLLNMGYAKFRQYDKILQSVDEDIDYIKSTGNEANLLNVLFFKAQACAFSGKMDDAQTTINEIEKRINNHKRIPIFFTQYLITKIKFRIESIKDLDRNNNDFRTGIVELKKLSGKLLRKVKKNVAVMTEAYHLKARILLLQNNYKAAGKYLRRSIAAGENYNSRPDLSCVYFETGKFLSDPDVKYNELNGQTANYYLEKAKSMFSEMQLDWDLKEYEEYMNERG